MILESWKITIKSYAITWRNPLMCEKMNSMTIGSSLDFHNF